MLAPSLPYSDFVSTPPNQRILRDSDAGNGKRKRVSSTSSSPSIKRVRVESLAMAGHPSASISPSVSLPALDSHFSDSSPISSPITPRNAGPFIEDVLPPSPVSNELELPPTALTFKQSLFLDAGQGAELLRDLIERVHKETGTLMSRAFQGHIDKIELRNRELHSAVVTAEVRRGEERGAFEEEIRRLKKRLEGEAKAKADLQKELKEWKLERTTWMNMSRINGRKREAGVMTVPVVTKVDQAVRVDSIAQTPAPSLRKSASTRSLGRSSRKKAFSPQTTFANVGEELQYYKDALESKCKEVESVKAEKETVKERSDTFRSKWFRQQKELEERIRATDFEARRIVEESDAKLAKLEKAVKRANLIMIDGSLKFIYS
ncbi:hypothetical protein CPB83DRAFT_201137 [Crepidotus variabilis]|uniref:Uncharacterized protein n=1 Tax=Crepidotus variabilis TaxID=179855 RepID=A0A9P6JRT9_9AGAR|nr:hypothetical protein CPB83DRAFT_201137 [Crepidotus variabilis]